MLPRRCGKKKLSSQGSTISMVKSGHRSLLAVRSCLALPTFVTALPASLGHRFLQVLDISPHDRMAFVDLGLVDFQRTSLECIIIIVTRSRGVARTCSVLSGC
mmetsp:Transcript_26500/g.38988  ORF Transcript_26500/g.38988 Transcript_26500/m.38988 type:complete len:103 (-) Transcript_26500:1494-1802(-)